MPNLHCVAVGCTSDSRKFRLLDKYPWMNGVTFHKLPGSVAERRIWYSLLRRGGEHDQLSFEKLNRYHRVCSRHFVDGRPSQDNPHPTLFEYNSFKVTKSPRTPVSRKRGYDKLTPETPVGQTVTHPMRPMRLQLVLTKVASDHGNIGPEVACYMEVGDESDGHPRIDSSFATYDVTPSVAEHNYCQPSSRVKSDFVSHSCQTDLTMEDIAAMEARISIPTRPAFDELVTKSDDSVSFYTGFPGKDTLNGVYTAMADNVDNMKYWRGHGSAEDKYYEQGGRNKPGPKRLLSPWLEFLMTLIWMRLALPHQLLSDLFGVGTSTVQRIVITWVMAMNTVLVPVFLPWPSRETVDEYMPEKFKKYFPRTRVIIDCTELYIQRPRDPDAQHKTYSSYKSWNTLKLLIGISPVGNITFVSKAWSGNSSDKFVTKNSGLLDIIEPFDHVMADRGFQIEDLLLPHGAKLIAPPFTRKCDYGKGKRLNAAEIIQTRNIALLRIHVERAIERMKRWEILHRLPNRSVSFASELASVIAGLCNLLPPLVED